MKGACHSCNRVVQHKSPLTVQHLSYIHNHLTVSQHLDNLLFNTQINMGFSALLHLGELVSPNKVVLRDWNKVTMQQLPIGYAFWLPCHKVDMVFEGNHVICQRILGTPDPFP